MFSQCGKTSATRSPRNRAIPKAGQRCQQPCGRRAGTCAARRTVRRRARRTCPHSSRSCRPCHEARRSRRIRLLAKARTRDGSSDPACAIEPARKLDVAVAGLRPARLNPQHHDLALGSPAKRARAPDCRYARASPITWSAGNTPMTASGIDRFQNVRRQTDGRRRIALRRLRQNLPRGNLGKLPHDGRRADGRWSESRSAPERMHGAQAVHGLLNQRPLAQKVSGLVWRRRGGCAARSACRGRPARIRP